MTEDNITPGELLKFFLGFLVFIIIGVLWDEYDKMRRHEELIPYTPDRKISYETKYSCYS